MADTLRILAIGDVVGQPGLRALFAGLGDLVRRLDADLVVANAENAVDGFGLDPPVAERLFACGVHVISSGNHIWQRREILPMLEARSELLRPENYPPGVPGHGHCIVTVKDTSVAVLNLEGRVNLSPLRDPFAIGRSVLRQARGKARVCVVDFHAESVEEKEALAAWLDGEASAVFGTHTHVQTADERILPKGTAFIADIGMSGPVEGVIGMRRETAIHRSLSQMPLKMVVQEGPAEIQGCLITIDVRSGRATAIERVRERSAV
ncbi:MAG: metallophosphoesterase [Spirochaetes bacterium RBG_13_68_11]|nr:MAG: metallophosphoesterase [Spirochaetes bacterium RBG_13_68_11]